MWFNYAREWGKPYDTWGRGLQQPLLPDHWPVPHSEEAEIYYRGGVRYLHGRVPKERGDSTARWQPDGTSDQANQGLDRIASGDANDFVRGLISDKTRYAGIAAHSLHGLIDDRFRIREKNLAQIDYDICHAVTLLYELLPSIRLGGTERQRQTLSMALFGLEREKRMEDVSCWRDISQVQQEFVTARAEYAAAARREGLFQGGSYLDR
jgi:hypothetical protein